MALIQKRSAKKGGKTFGNRRLGAAKETVTFSSTDDDNTTIEDTTAIDEADLQTRDNVLGESATRSIAMAGRRGLATGGRRSSTKNRSLAKPLQAGLLRKPFARTTAVEREVRRPLPWLTTSPSTYGKNTRVAPPPNLLRPARTGVSRASLAYEATDRIKNLAKPRRPVPAKTNGSGEPRMMGKPLPALSRKLSLRIERLAQPRVRANEN